MASDHHMGSPFQLPRSIPFYCHPLQCSLDHLASICYGNCPDLQICAQRIPKVITSMLRNICSLLQPYIPSELPSREKPAQKICNLTLRCLLRPLGMAGTGRIRTVAISHKERLDTLPDVSTVKEISKSISYGLWGPRGVPKEVGNKLLKAYTTALKEKGIETTRILNGLDRTGASWVMKN